MGTGVRVPSYRPKPTRQQRLAYAGVGLGAASFLTVLALQPGLVAEATRQVTGLVREVPVASGPLPGTVLERLPHPNPLTHVPAAPAPSTGTTVGQPAAPGGASGASASAHFVSGPQPTHPGQSSGGHPQHAPHPGHSAGPITGIIHPPVVIAADGADQATGGASSPVTGPAVQVVDHVTGAVDGLIGGGHGHGHAYGHTKHHEKAEHVKHGHAQHAGKRAGKHRHKRH